MDLALQRFLQAYMLFLERVQGRPVLTSARVEHVGWAPVSGRAIVYVRHRSLQRCIDWDENSHACTWRWQHCLQCWARSAPQHRLPLVQGPQQPR